MKRSIMLEAAVAGILNAIPKDKLKRMAAVSCSAVNGCQAQVQR